MRIVFILIIQLLIGVALTAQTISGTIKNANGGPVAGATIALLKAGDSSVVKLQLSKDSGLFAFPNIVPGNYFITASFVGYTTISTTLIAVKTFDITIDDLILKRATNDLKAVVVTSKKPIIQVRGDKTILNVEGTINATGNNTLELLRKSPGVTIDGNDNVSMNAKNGVQIFIDGRPSPLAGSDLSAYLKSLPSSEVEAIELITNPSARYEAAGNAGIINIRLKKNKAFGTNGSVNIDYNHGGYSRINNGASINNRTAKLNVFGSYNYNAGTYRKELTMNRTLLDSAFNQFGVLFSKNQTHNVKAGADFFINKNSTWGFVTNGNFSNNPFNSTSSASISYAPTSTLDRTLVAENNSSSYKKNMNYNLNYLYANTNGKTLNLNADYGFYKITGNQLQPNTYFNKNEAQINKIVYEMESPSEIDIYSIKGDYEQPFKKGKLAVGVKASYVQTDNDFKRFNVIGTAREIDRINSNHFIYNENINAAYINYSRTYKKLSFDAGLRAENTIVKGQSIGARRQGVGYIAVDSSLYQNYINLFPAIAINYSQDNNNQWRLSVNRRIDRPAYQELNPFEIKVDDYLVQKGNAYLRPQYTSGVSLTWVYKQKLNTSIEYNHIKNISAWLADTTETSKSLITKRNLAGQRLITMNISYPYQYKNYSLFANVSSSYTSFNADLGTGRVIAEKGFGLNIYLQNSIKFAKKWSADLSGFYNSLSLQEGNMRLRSMWSVDAGVQTRLLKDKATVKFAVSDVFKSLRFSNSSQFAGQKVFYNSTWNSQQAKLSIAFRIGSSDVKAARQRKTGAEEEMKRVQ